MTIKKIQVMDAQGNIRKSTTRNLTIDFSSYEDVRKHFQILKVQLSNLRQTEDGVFTSKADKVKKIYLACCAIHSTDITSVYSNMKLDENKKYYVHAHCNPDFTLALKKEGKSTFAASLGLTKMPFYIGKGTGDRAQDLNRSGEHRKMRQKLKSFGREVEVKIIQDNLTELEAFMLESKLIDIFGLMSISGKLVNLDEGVNSRERKLLYADHLKELNSYYKNSRL